MDVEFIRYQRYKNAVRIKHTKNRRVTISKQKANDDVVFMFERADVPAGDLDKSTAVTSVNRGVMTTGLVCSRQAALALYVGLQDYFTRIAPE